MRTVICVLIALMPGAALGAEPPDLLPPSFDAYAADVMRDWAVPGLGVAVSHGGETVVRTYGVREISRPARVDADTMFMIASITKTFTTAAVAVLVDQGKVRWDDPVRKHLPQLALGDGWVAEHVTVRDLLGMRSGIETDGDWLEEVPFATSKTVMDRARFFGQALPFRSGFEYNNYNYTIIGELIERVSGLPWNVFVKSHLLKPLGLSNTQLAAQDFIPVEHLAPGGEVILPGGPVGAAALVPPFLNVVARHAMHPTFARHLALHPDELNNTVAPYARFSIDASTSAFSSTHDLHKWGRMWLGLGEVDGVRVLKEETVREMRRHQSLSGGDGLQPFTSAAERIEKRQLTGTGYGLGFQLGVYGEHAFVGHGGGDIGVGSRMMTFPAKDLTVVVLPNNSLYSGGGYASAALLYRILDHHFGYPEKDWNAERKARYLEAGQRDRDADEKALQAARSELPMSVPADGYLGIYDDGGHRGRVEVHRIGGALRLIVLPDLESAAADPALAGHVEWARKLPPARSADLTHWGGDTFHVRWRGPRRSAELISFTIADGKATSLELPAGTRGGPARFTKVSPQ